MEGTFSKIRNFFSDGIFGNIIRFLFDRFFGGIFTNNINFSNIINLKNCHFQNLTIDADKINKKAFKNGPFKLFSGKIGSISIKFPSLNALLTESLEVRLDRLDVLLVMNDVDFTKAEEEVKNLLAKLNSGELLQNIIEENPSGSNAPEDFDVYKKIINRILFNIKLKVENVCLRIVSEKPYKEVRLPIAPCFMLKIGKVEIKKNYDEPQNMMNSDSSNASPLNFAKHQDYSINIYGITMHMMANYELNPEEYVGKTVDSKAEFPFTYPNESHPSTFFVCACRKVNKKPGASAIADDSSNDMEPISIRINFSNDKSKSVTIDMPNIEVMLDFLKIKYLSRYVDKFMEWKRYSDYKKALQEQYTSPKKSPKASPQVVMHARKGSFGIDLLQEPISSNRPSRVSEDSRLATFGTMDNLMPDPQNQHSKNQKIRIAGLDIDVDYFQKSNAAENQGELPENVSKELNEMEGINEIVSEPFEMTAENLLDTSNVHINLKLKSMYIYFLKNCTAFLDTEFKRWWLFGSEPQNDLQKSFNKKIPMSYFQLKLTSLNLSVFTKESQINLGFSSLKILDVSRVDTPLRTKANPGSGLLNFSTINKSRVPWDKSDIFHSFRFDKSVMGMGTMMGSALRVPDLKRNSSVDTNEQSMLFQSAMSDITKEFLQIREMRKQILDWDIDPKKEHFCVNVIFKFNKNIKYSGGRGGSDSYKTIKYLEDSVIHCPLNSEPLCEDLREDRTTPTVRLNTKGGKVTALIDFPSIYVNFYMGIVHDINFLLHNASDSYKMCENWYREQNHNLIVKWDQELRELSKDGPSKEELQQQREKEFQCKEKVNEALEAFYKRQNQLLNLDIAFKTPLIKLAVNLENPKRDNSYCFCGFGSHYCPETIIYNKVFKKEFVVLEVSHFALKVLKTSINDDFLQNGLNKKAVQLTTHTLFQSLDIYIPSKITDENRIFMMKLLSIQAIYDEKKFIMPSIALTIYEDNSENLLKPLSPNRYPSRPEEEKSIENQSPILGGKDSFTKFYGHHMNKNITADSSYLKKLQEDSTISLDVTFPRFEINASKQSLEFLQGFSNDWISLMKDLNEKVSHILEQERRIFSSILEVNKKPSKLPPTTNISFYIEEAMVQVFQDEQVNYYFQQKIDSQRSRNVNFSNLASSAILLDASFSNNVLERSFAPTPFQSPELRYIYPRREFERGLYYAFKLIFRHIDAIIYKNPKEVTDVIHLEIQDLLIVDRAQEKPFFGSFVIPTTASERDASREFFDEATREFEAQDCIAYKQSSWNSWAKPMGATRTIKEPEAFIEGKNLGDIWILDNTHKSFEYKNRNVFRVGLLKNVRNGRPVMNVDACIGQLVLRSDFKLSFIEMFKDIAGAFAKDKQPKKEEDLNNQMRFDSSIDRKVSSPPDDTQIVIQCSLENILIDINPYLSFDYCKTFGKVNYNIDPENLIREYSDLLFYSDTRSLIAIESLGLRLLKTGNSVQFDEFNLSSLDLFMRQQKGDATFKENRVILRSKEDNLFDRKFEELTNFYGFKSHPFYLSGVSVKFTGENIQTIDVKLDRIEVSVYSDTIPIIEKHIHLLLCLIDKRKYRENDGNAEIEEEKEQEVPLSINSSKAAASGQQQQQQASPKDQIYMEDEEIEIDREYFAPLDANHGSIRRSQHEDSDDDVEEIDDDYEDQRKETDDDAKSYEMLDSMPNMSTSFVSSATCLYFDEENLHDFTLENQTTSKKITFKIGEIALRIFESFEFEDGPQVLEVPLSLFGEEEEEGEGGLGGQMSGEERLAPAKYINENEKSECIMVVLESFSLGLILFNKNPELRTNLSWRASVILENFEILDCFKGGKKNEANCKILSKQQPKDVQTVRYTLLQSGRKNNEMVMFNTFDAIFECFDNNGCQQKDLRTFIALHPLEVHFAKPHYNFIKLFQAKMKLKSPANLTKRANSDDDIINREARNQKESQRNKKPSDLFVSFFQIAPCEVKMNINLDIAVFNLDLLQNLKLRFPNIIVRGADSTDDLKKELAAFYIGKAKSQLGQLVKDLPILRNIKNLTNATLNLFYSPYMNYRHSGSFLGGLKDGVVGFAGSVSNESLNLFSFVTIIFDNMTNLTGIRGNRNNS